MANRRDATGPGPSARLEIAATFVCMGENGSRVMAWASIAAGLVWLLGTSWMGWGSLLLGLVPGLLGVIGGGSALLYPEESRGSELLALGAGLGLPLALLLAVLSSFWLGLLLAVISAWLFASAGLQSLAREPEVAGVPKPEASIALGFKVALDEAVLGTRALGAGALQAAERDRIAEEARHARAYMEQRGWLDRPAGYHAAPPALDEFVLKRSRTIGSTFEHLSFESEYEPYIEEPGRERWLSYVANRTAHAWVLEHADGPRPWLLCVHGFRMGNPRVDLAAFRAVELHQRLGLNLILPVLPLHGPRKIGRRSGDRFLAGDLMDTVHAEAQAMWDLRRVLGWVAGRGAIGVGAFGLSLGGYTVALLAGLEEQLSCAIAGIPAADFARLERRSRAGSPQASGEPSAATDAEAVLRVVAPLAIPPLVPRERRFVFGGSADRIVPPDQVRDLWEHWERPRICWYAGSHLSYRIESEVREFIGDVLRSSGLGSNPRS